MIRISMIIVSVFAFFLSANVIYAQDSTTRPVIVGITTPNTDGPRLLIRHLQGEQAARTPSSIEVTANNNQFLLGNDLSGVPLPVIEEQSYIAIVIDNSSTILSSPEETARYRDALTRALQENFTPGELFSIRLIQENSTGEIVQLVPNDNLDELVAFASQITGTGVSSETFVVLDELIRLLSGNTQLPMHREILVLTNGIDNSGLSIDAIEELALEQNISISTAIVRTSINDENTRTSARQGANQFCVLARATGGICVRENTEPNSLGDTLVTAIAQAQSVFVTQIQCVNANDSDDYNLIVRTGDFQSEPMAIDGDRLRCDSYQRFDPNYIPPPITPIDPENLLNQEENQETSEQETASKKFNFSLLFYPAGIILFILIIRLSRKKNPILEDETFSFDSQGSSLLDDLPANINAAALSAAGPAKERPNWLRETSMENTRQQIRGHLSKTNGMHLVCFQKGTINEVTLQRVITVGNRRDSQIHCHEAPQGQIAARISFDNKQQITIQSIGVLPIIINGQQITESKELSIGDEILIGTTLIEVRFFSQDGARAIFAAGNRKAERKLHVSEPRAFNTLSIGLTTTLLGRDPLPYQGLRAIPAKLVIPQISNDHLELWISGGILYLRDLDSSNGVTIDGNNLSPFVVIPVAAGQRIGLSKIVSFVVE